MTFRERIEWLFRMGLLVFVLAAAAFLSAVMAMRFAIQGREVDMPNLVGKSSADAQAILQGRGLQLKDRRPGLQQPSREFRRPAEPAGGRTHESFPGRTRRSQPGTAKRDDTGARGRKSSRGADSTAASGPATGRGHIVFGARRCLETRFCSRTRLRERAPQALAWICWWRKANPQPAYVMPWLVGMPLAEADRLLSSGGLKLAKTTYTPSAQWPKGTVIEQTPDQGSKVTERLSHRAGRRAVRWLCTAAIYSSPFEWPAVRCAASSTTILQAIAPVLPKPAFQASYSIA